MHLPPLFVYAVYFILAMESFVFSLPQSSRTSTSRGITTTTSSSPRPEIFTTTQSTPPLSTSTSVQGAQCAADQTPCGSACCDTPHGVVGAGEFCASPEKSLCCSTFSAGYCGGVCCPGSTGVCRNDRCLVFGSSEDCKSRTGNYNGLTCSESPGCNCFNGCCVIIIN